MMERVTINLSYLCATHRQWLFDDFERAEQHWLQWIERGIQAYEQQQYHEAVSFLGCAFEISDYLLRHAWPDVEVSVSHYTYSNICLARAYEQIGEQETRRYLMAEADRRLADFYPDLSSYNHLARCKQSLKARADSAYWVHQQLQQLMAESLAVSTNKAH